MEEGLPPLGSDTPRRGCMTRDHEDTGHEDAGHQSHEDTSREAVKTQATEVAKTKPRKA